jgi:hypothetical protein
VVVRDLGVHLLPASGARRDAEPAMERLYTVSFPASEVFSRGDHTIHVDLYRSALEPADGG